MSELTPEQKDLVMDKLIYIAAGVAFERDRCLNAVLDYLERYEDELGPLSLRLFRELRDDISEP